MTVGLLFHRIKHFRAMGGSGSNLDNWIFLGKYLQMSPTKLVTNHYGGPSHWAPRLDSIKTNLDKQIFETLKIVCDSQEFIQFWANSLTARYRKVGIALSSQVKSSLTVIENLIPSWVETRDSIWYDNRSFLFWVPRTRAESSTLSNLSLHCSVFIMSTWRWNSLFTTQARFQWEEELKLPLGIIISTIICISEGGWTAIIW